MRGNDSTATLNPRNSNKRNRSEDNIQLESLESQRIRHRGRRAENQPITINTGRQTTNLNNHESSDEDSTSDDEPNIQIQEMDDGTSSDVEILSTYWRRTGNGRPMLYFKCKYSKGRLMWISFEDMKIDCPNTTAKYIIARKTGGQKHKSPLKWAENHMRSLKRITAKIAETYGTTGYTEC